MSDVDDEGESDDPLFEITVRSYREPDISGKTVFWGIPATNAKVGSRVEVRISFFQTSRPALANMQ
jgi:salicylate hydroxylase